MEMMAGQRPWPELTRDGAVRHPSGTPCTAAAPAPRHVRQVCAEAKPVQTIRGSNGSAAF